MSKIYKTYADAKTIGELREFLKQINANWTPDDKIPDDQDIPEVSLGGNIDNPELKREVGKLDLIKILIHIPSNPFLIERWKDHGIKIPDKDNKLSLTIDPETLKPIDVKKVVAEEFDSN